MRARVRVHAKASVRRGAWMVAAGAATLLAVSACREPGTGFSSPNPSPSTSPTPSATAAPSPSLSDEERYPNLSRFTDPFDQFAYKSGHSECRLLGVERTAEAFGGNPDDPSSVARAYAVATFPQAEEHREATSQGCLDAFETEQ